VPIWHLSADWARASRHAEDNHADDALRLRKALAAVAPITMLIVSLVTALATPLLMDSASPARRRAALTRMRVTVESTTMLAIHIGCDAARMGAPVSHARIVPDAVTGLMMALSAFVIHTTAPVVSRAPTLTCEAAISTPLTKTP